MAGGAGSGPIRIPHAVVLQRAHAAEYFRGASLLDGSAPDPRMADAMELIRSARQPDGTWTQAHGHPGRAWFEVDIAPGEPSKWLTLFGIRVLNWWEAYR